MRSGHFLCAAMRGNASRWKTQPVRCPLHHRPLGVLFVGVAAAVVVLSGCTSSPSAVPHPTSTTTSHSTSSTNSPGLVSETPTAIAFFDPEKGFGAFTRQGVASCQDLVGPTTNGGTTFGPLVPVTSWNCADNASVRSLAFDDHGDGFLYGPDLMVTHDGGKTWAQNTQPGAVLAVEALGLSIWMVESGCPSASTAATCPLRLLESTDGGRTWSSSSAAPPNAVGSPYLGQGAAGQTWLVRISKSSAYLLSNPVTNSQGLANNAPLSFTKDGGASWSSRSIRCGIYALSVVLSAAPDGTLLAVCASGPEAGSQAKSALRSLDGGISWTVQSSCPFTGSGSSPSCGTEPLNSGYLAGIDALSADTVFLFGGRSSLLVSHDGGAHWQAVQPLIGDTSGGTQQAIFFNKSDGVVLGEDGSNNDIWTIWHTTDGGEYWNAVVPTSVTSSPNTSAQACASSQLTVELGPSGVAMGHVGSVVSFKNISNATCTLDGYPGLKMLDGAGHPIPTEVTDGTSYTVPSIPEQIVTLVPDAVASFELGFSDSTGYGTASCSTSAKVEITPPSSDRPITVSWHIQPYGGSTIQQLHCGEVIVSPVYAGGGQFHSSAG